MRHGCISLGKVRCDGCEVVVPYAERYLIVEEEDGAEVESGTKACYCVDCSLARGYARYREEKADRVLTFFPEEPESPDAGEEDPAQ